jgi:hypothetical protein
MGERTEVDLMQLRRAADRVMQAADAVGRIDWPSMDFAEMPGSAVADIAAADRVSARLADVVATMRGWSHAAHTSADAMESADRRNGERFAE